MSDKLIKFLKQRIDIQVEDSLTSEKIKDLSIKAYEKGFTNGYIMAIDYINTLLRHSVISIVISGIKKKNAKCHILLNLLFLILIL